MKRESTPHPVLVVLGPTASGKTSLSLKLASLFRGEVVSADSRQVYQGLNLLTGKGLPPESTISDQSSLFHLQPPFQLGKYSLNQIPLWLYDVMPPTHPLNVANYFQLAWQVITHIGQQQSLPIVAGGTGFYIKNLFSPPETLGVPINPSLRQRLESCSVRQLQQEILAIDQKKFYSMNDSDKANPRRLIRALEVALAPTHPRLISPRHQKLIIGLMPQKEKMHQRILTNIRQRAGSKLSRELTWFVNLPGFSWQLPAATSTGSWWWYQYQQQKMSQEEAIQRWFLQEKQYAKRQMTYFQKMEQVHWFDPDHPGFEQAVVDLVKSWYANTNEKHHPKS